MVPQDSRGFVNLVNHACYVLRARLEVDLREDYLSSLRVSFRSDGNHVVVVCDNGVGTPEDIMPCIFNANKC